MNKAILGSAMLLTIAVVCIAGAIYMFNISQPVATIMSEREWYPDVLGDADPGAGASGVLRVYIVKHGTYSYTKNLSVAGHPNATLWEYGDSNNSHLGSNVHYSEAFDVVVKVRWNVTHAYSSGNTTWMPSWVRGNLTCNAFSESDSLMGEVHIVNNTNYMWVHYYWDGTAGGGGAGETISRGQNVSTCSFTFDAYY